MSGSAQTKGRQRSQRPGPSDLRTLSGGLATFLILLATMTAGGGQPLLPHAVPAPPAHLGQAVARHDRCQLVVEVSPAAARVCDDLSVRVSVRHPKDAAVKEVKLGNVLETFLVRESRQPPSQAEGDAVLSEQVYVLEPLQAGRIAIGPVEVTVVTGLEGASGQVVLRSEPIAVDLQTVVALPPRLEDLRPAARLSTPAKSLPEAGHWRWAGPVGVAIAVLVGLVWRWVRRQAAAAAPASPRSEARRRLAELTSDGQAPADVEAFYVALADIVRQYLVDAVAVPALAQTSEECLRAVAEQRVLPDAAAEALARFFRVADLVKFARWRPHPAEMTESLRQAEFIIQAPLNLPGQGGAEQLSAENAEATP